MVVAWKRATKTTDLGQQLTDDPQFLSTISSRVSSELQSIQEGPQLTVEGLGTLDTTDRVFLDPNVMVQLWDDNTEMLLPSWIGRLPPRAGSSQHGKLSADQLRTICTINLVATLVRLWSISPQGSKWRMVLDNYMDLVAAVRLAHMKTLPLSDIDKYHSYMHRYLRTLQDLYPHAPISPLQHMSLHLTELMKRFGPVHAWRCFPFERYNRVLQNIPTNYKFGKSQSYLVISYGMAYGHQVNSKAPFSIGFAWARTSEWP